MATGNVKAIQEVAAPECKLDGYPVGDFRIGDEDSEYRKIRDRVFLIIRVVSDKAVAYTRGQLPPLKDESGTESEWKPDAVEKWSLKRDRKDWRLVDYRLDVQLSQALNMLRMEPLQYAQPGDHIVPPPIVLIITDDPKLTKIEVKPGVISTGHDYTVKLP